MTLLKAYCQFLFEQVKEVATPLLVIAGILLFGTMLAGFYIGFVELIKALACTDPEQNRDAADCLFGFAIGFISLTLLFIGHFIYFYYENYNNND